MDGMLVSGGEYDSAEYTGPWNSNQGVPIYGAANPPLNSFAVPSGAFSGSSVVQITQVNTYTNVTGLGRIGPGFRSVEPNHNPTVGQGDSGGPLSQTVSLSDGSLAVMAGGIITSGVLDFHGTQCQGIQDDSRRCGWASFYVQIEDLMSHWGVTIGVTSPPI